MTPTVAVPSSSTSIRVGFVTWAGLALSLFSLITLRQLFHPGNATPGATLVVLREACMFACAGLLLWLVRRGERRPLRSIGFGTAPIWKSVSYGLLTAAAATLPALLISKLSGYGHGANSQAFARLPVWLVLLVAVRAGVVEELFYRGYAMTRLQEVGAGRILSFVGPLLCFAAAHWSGGWPNIGMAAAMGAVFAGFFAWRKDLLSNMIGHFTLDFVSNVLPLLLA